MGRGVEVVVGVEVEAEVTFFFCLIFFENLVVLVSTPEDELHYTRRYHFFCFVFCGQYHSSLLFMVSFRLSPQNTPGYRPCNVLHQQII